MCQHMGTGATSVMQANIKHKLDYIRSCGLHVYESFFMTKTCTLHTND